MESTVLYMSVGKLTVAAVSNSEPFRGISIIWQRGWYALRRYRRNSSKARKRHRNAACFRTTLKAHFQRGSRTWFKIEPRSLYLMFVARWRRGGAGPGGSDSSRQDCSWPLKYGAHSERLRDAVARLTRVIANGSMPWKVLRALLSNRLIALDKCPGPSSTDRDIRIGECLRRVMAKAVMMVADGEVREVCGSD